MTKEFLLALELLFRCDQACIDEGFESGEYLNASSECRCHTDITAEIMLKRPVKYVEPNYE